MEARPTGGRQTSAWAIASLVMGVLGLVGLWVVGPVLAVVFAGQARREIEASGGDVGGAELARAGRILGVTGLVLAAAMVLIAGAVLTAAVVLGVLGRVGAERAVVEVIKVSTPVPAPAP